MSEPTNTVNLAILPEAQQEIAIEYYTHSSSGKKATHKQLSNIVLTRLDSGVCLFIFRKQSGALRKAIGTRRVELIPLTKQAKGGIAPSAAKVNFYDLVELDWRSYNTDSIVAVLIF